MWKNFLIFLSNLGILSLAFVHPLQAQEDTAGLMVTSHIICVNQGLRELETFYYGITEEMEFENKGVTTYQGELAFWVGEGEDLQVVAFEENGNDVNLEVAIVEGIAKARLQERVFIKPGQKLKVNLDYKVFFTDEKKNEEFPKKILYSHAKESLQFKVNPVENLGFQPQLSDFPFRKSGEESSWFVSPKLSPKVGEVYTSAIVKEGEEPVLPEEEREEPDFEEQKEEIPPEKQKEREPIIVAQKLGKLPEQLSFFHTQVKRWVWENILLVFVLNDVLLLGLVGYKCGWFKSITLPRFPQPKPPSRRKGGKRRKR